MTQIIKNILCFGDSNTWGLNAKTGKRFESHNRWPAQLGIKLGSRFNIIEAGEPNRTLVNIPPFDGQLTGVRYLKPYLNNDLAIIIIALGTNDLKKRFDLSAKHIAQGLNQLITQIKQYYVLKKYAMLPDILVINPTQVQLIGPYSHIYDGAIEKLLPLKHEFKMVAEQNESYFFDLNNIIDVLGCDGIHFEASHHAIISDAIHKKIQKILNAKMT